MGSRAGTLDLRCGYRGFATRALQITSPGVFSCRQNTSMNLARQGHTSGVSDNRFEGTHGYLDCPQPTTTTADPNTSPTATNELSSGTTTTNSIAETKSSSTNSNLSLPTCDYTGENYTTPLLELFTYAAIRSCCNFINITSVGEQAGVLDLRCHAGGWGSPALQIRSTGAFDCPENTIMDLSRHGYSNGGDNRFMGTHEYLDCPQSSTRTTTTQLTTNSGAGNLFDNACVVSALTLSFFGLL